VTEIVTAEFYIPYRLSTIIKLSTLLHSFVPLIAHRLPLTAYRDFLLLPSQNTACVITLEDSCDFLQKRLYFSQKKGIMPP